MTFKQIYQDIQKMQSEDISTDYGKWIDEGVEKLEALMNKEPYEAVVAEATSMALIYKLNHKKAMGAKKKREMIIALMKKHGLLDE